MVRVALEGERHHAEPENHEGHGIFGSTSKSCVLKTQCVFEVIVGITWGI